MNTIIRSTIKNGRERKAPPAKLRDIWRLFVSVLCLLCYYNSVIIRQYSLKQPLSFLKDSPDILNAALTFVSVPSVSLALDCTSPRGSGQRVKGTCWRTALCSYKGNPLFTALPTVSFGSLALCFVPGTVPLSASEWGRRWGLGTGGETNRENESVW